MMADGLPSFFFSGPGANESDEMLALRKRIAMGMIGQQRRGYPKNIGEGLTSIGDAIGEMGMMRQLAQSQAAVDARREADKAAMPPAPTPTVAPTQTSDASAAIAPGGPKLPALAYDEPADTTPAPQQTAAAEPETPTPSPVGASAYGPTPTDISSASYGASIVPPMAPSPRNAIATAMLQPPTAPGVPQVNPTQAGGVSLPSSTDTGSSSALGGQPPDVMSDIAKAPDVPMAPGAQLAQATVPPPGAVPPPIQQPQVIPRVPIAPQATTLGPEPSAPSMPAMSGPQQSLQRMLADPTITDPVRRQAFQTQFNAWEEQRKEAYEKLKADYERQRADWLTSSAAENERKRLQTQTETAQQKSELQLQQERQAAGLQQRLGNIPQEVWVKNLDKSKESIQPIIASVNSIKRAREAAAKMYTGQAADVNTFAAGIMAAAGWPADPKLTATQQFKTAMANIIGANRKAIVGAGAQSDYEYRTLEQASAADAKLQPETIMKSLDAAERLNLQTALAHQQQVRRFAGTEDPERIGMVYGGYGVPNIADMVPQRGLDRLVKNYNPKGDNSALLTDFDNTFHTPGLAEKILRERHLYQPQGR